MNWKLGQRPGSQHNKVKMTKEEKEEQEKRKAESDAAWREALGKKPRSNPVQKPMNQPKTQNSFQNGVAKAEQEIMNKANSVGVKLKNIDSNLMKQLEEKGFYGLIDQLKRGKITEDQAKRSLAGDKSAIPLPSTTQWGDEPLIFGRTHAEIARMQKSGKLRK